MLGPTQAGQARPLAEAWRSLFLGKPTPQAPLEDTPPSRMSCGGVDCTSGFGFCREGVLGPHELAFGTSGAPGNRSLCCPSVQAWLHSLGAWGKIKMWHPITVWILHVPQNHLYKRLCPQPVVPLGGDGTLRKWGQGGHTGGCP